jgi:hypothetical protein
MADLDVMFGQPVPDQPINQDVFLFVDPAAGGPNSDYAILSIARQKGLVTVSRVGPGAAHLAHEVAGGGHGAAHAAHGFRGGRPAVGGGALEVGEQLGEPHAEEQAAHGVFFYIFSFYTHRLRVGVLFVFG